MSKYAHNRTLRTVFDRIPLGALMLDRQGRVVFSNAQGTMLLKENDHLHVSPTQQLVIHDDRAQQIMANLVAKGELSDEEEYLLLLGGRSGPIMMTLVAIQHYRENLSQTDDAWAVALLAAPHVFGSFVQRRFCDGYKLSSSEAEVARSLAETGDIRQFCEKRGVGVEAARTHLKSVFRKTNAHTRAKLLSLIFREWILQSLRSHGMG